MADIPAYWNELPFVSKLIAVVIAVLLTAFVATFLVPGLILGRRLTTLIGQLPQGGDTDRLFELADRALGRIWGDYKKTLHEQRLINPATGLPSKKAKATQSASGFFNPESVVDSRLGTEFFKHLPGILTGLGIIGTFFGLIHGISAFHVSENPAAVSKGLEGLVKGVKEAFHVSAVAISLAILITFLEKVLITWLYQKTEKLAHVIDAEMETGVGEEYLARLTSSSHHAEEHLAKLAKSSEQAESQLRVLKEALVTDFERILNELSERQLNALAASGQQVGHSVGAAIQETLAEPLARIGEAVHRVSGEQGEATLKLVTDVLAAFSQRLQDLFGGQINGINELQQQTVAALSAALVQLETMASTVNSAGERATDSMAAKLSEALDSMAARQGVLNAQMTEFVSQIRSQLAGSQTETNEALRGAVSTLNENVSGLVSTLRNDVEQASRANADRERTMARQLDATTEALSSQIEAVVTTVAQSAAEMRSAVDAMRGITSEALTKMNAGAETLYVAASDFAKAGQGVTNTLKQSSHVGDRLAEAASAVNASTQALQRVVADYGSSRQALQLVLEQLAAVVDGAKRDARVTDDLVKRIEGSARVLAQAQRQADEYLTQVSQVLADSHQAFADQMGNTVGKANATFHQSLTTATKLLSDAIQNLEAVVGAVPMRKRA